MIEARIGRNTHRYICLHGYCGYTGLWLKNREQAEQDGHLHRMYVHKEHT